MTPARARAPGCCIGPMALMVTYLDLSAVAHASRHSKLHSIEWKVALTSTIRRCCLSTPPPRVRSPTIDSEHILRRHDCALLRRFCTAFSAADVFCSYLAGWGYMMFNNGRNISTQSS
ncbi:hypothetical protein BD626DRAFT_530750 [Schizophyllum amplum]|uniref:Uncharacterized protein n=1 Tax=Schizophyllum amplum TaxID=97359 RepID=A0A550BRS8_9AGAR|nr:hypothetical protein BD626DRAFT_530750 [Auriculariopsis ampla]